MLHLEELQQQGNQSSQDFLIRATGRYYTHEKVAGHMIDALLNLKNGEYQTGQTIKVIDPFTGDGRLLEWLLKEWKRRKFPKVRWEITAWDLDAEGLAAAKLRLDQLVSSKYQIEVNFANGDTFEFAANSNKQYDIIITNPPWEILKPDRRELAALNTNARELYIAKMRRYDQFLAENYPDSQPQRKFAGWGSNLSRVGLDVCNRLCKADGVIAIVLPASVLADQQSVKLRKKILSDRSLTDIAYFPAEAKLFGKADVASITATFGTSCNDEVSPFLTRYDDKLIPSKRQRLSVKKSFLDETGFVLPVSMGVEAFNLLQKLSEKYPSWAMSEGSSQQSLWAGRELDETGSRNWLQNSVSGSLFVKGKMIGRFTQLELPRQIVEKNNWTPPASMEFERIVWRDVSRPNQKRRLIATIIPRGWVAGNSLGVAYFRDNNPIALRALLGIMSSLVFEFQLRGHLATGHVSLSSLRKVCLPTRSVIEACPPLIDCVKCLLSGNKSSEKTLEAIVAKYMYQLSRKEFEEILSFYSKLEPSEKSAILDSYDSLPQKYHSSPILIPNHLSGSLSEVDMRMVKAVPPGGNWKNIPTSIPSKRLDQIRESYKQGKGSRSTYYGRLRPEMPSYTINTYFNRPGNGCHMHYEQDRVISQREAARLQSFPDSFIFSGAQGSVNNQIGNAVPPLLAFQIAKTLGTPGYFVDLFSGAGGLGLGFKWAGWQPVVANDIDKRFLETYSNNVHNSVVHGSITEESIRKQLIEIANNVRSKDSKKPFWILGGPPCQGFSTAGYKRVTGDDRNLLFWDYRKVLADLNPDGFVFENVTGLLNMQGGRVFEEVKTAFRSVMPNVIGWVLRAEEYAVPQRRTRVFLVGGKNKDFSAAPPKVLTSHEPKTTLFEDPCQVVGVQDALSDLPELVPGQDGSNLPYSSPPQNAYQEFMRGLLSPSEYLEASTSQKKS